MIQPSLRSPGKRLRELMDQGIVVLPGVFNALSAVVAYKVGAQALYISGGATTNALLGVPDIGLMTQSEFADQASKVCQVAPVPVISDADTGFGEGWNVVRAVIEMERSGLAGIHLEDQVSPKRCGHLEGKQLIPADQMESKLKAAVESKRDPSFMIIARTDAYSVEGLEPAIERAKRYVGAGVDAVFPEGLTSEGEFERFRKALAVPLLANMTEFGKTPLISASRFQELGYNMVIFPVTALRVAVKAMKEFYGDLLRDGTQADWMKRMATRDELYELIDYPAFAERDRGWAQQESSTESRSRL